MIATHPARWRLLLSPPMSGPDNMALDEALMARARRTGETVLRVYSWSRPTLSLGRHQRARGLYDEGALHRTAADVVRRPTGGRALLHHREVTYSVAAPLHEDEGVALVYARINALLADALNALGVSVEPAAPTTRAARPGATPCFAEPAAGELVLGGRKLVGSAQWRDDGALLQHGSILVDDDQVALPDLMREPGPPTPPAATLRAALGRAPTPPEVAEHLFHAARELADPAATPLELDDRTRRDALALTERHRDPDWIWRR
jgi:lipoate-protein ligase A